MITYQAVGRIVNDALCKATKDGKSIAEFNLACVEKKTKNEMSGKYLDVTTFIPCTKFNADAIKPYLLKGKRIAVTGTIHQDKWTDQNGVNKSKLVFYVNDIEFLESKNENATTQESAIADVVEKPAQNKKASTPDEFDDGDAPF